MKKRMVSIALAVVLALSLTIPASAKTETKTVTLTYAGIKVSLNGSAVNPADAQGNYIEPFAIDGTTYLPLRGIASALGLNVGWEQATHTVKLTSGGSSGSGARSSKTTYDAKTAVIQYMNIFIKLDGKDVWPLDANGNYVEPFAIDGTVYLPIRGIASALGLDVNWDQGSHTVGLSKKTVSATAAYEAFLRSKGYQSDTRDWETRPVEYTYLDIDGNGTDELIVFSAIDPYGFSNFAVYGYHASSNSVALIKGREYFAWDNTWETFDTFYCYMEPYYSSSRVMLCFSSVRPGMYGEDRYFYKLENGTLNYVYDVQRVADWSSGSDEYYFTQAGSRSQKTISAKTAQSYLSDGYTLIRYTLP